MKASSADEAYRLQVAIAQEEEREKRVEHLQQIAARRLGQLSLARGWTSWVTLWEEKVRVTNLLKQTTSRLLKPKMAASYAQWRYAEEAS